MDFSGYTASAWGNEYHNLPHDEALGAGAAGPGKTWVLLADPVPQIITEHERCRDREHPHHLRWGESTGWAIHLRRTVKRLEQSIVRTQLIFPRLDPGARWDATKTTWIFSSGYRFQFGHCKDPDSWGDYLSFQFTHIAYDELVEFEEEQYHQINSRLRSSDPILSTMLRIRAMSNPMIRREVGDNFSVKNPHWVRDYFVKPSPAGKTTLVKELDMGDGTTERMTRIYLPARLDDNPDKAFVRQYKRQLLSKPPHIRSAFLFGDWFALAGGFYAEEWNPNLHVCEPFAIPPDWPIFRSMDWGFKNPGCVLWMTMDPDDTLFVIRELTFLGKKDVEVALLIKDIETAMGLWQRSRSLISGPADVQLFEERGDSGKTKAQAMAEKGVAWIRWTDKSREANAEKFIGRLKDHQNGTVPPGIVFFKGCRRCIETIPAIPTDPSNSARPMDGGEDHWHDAVLYGCAYASRGRQALGAARRAELDVSDRDDEMDRPTTWSNSRGRYGYGGH